MLTTLERLRAAKDKQSGFTLIELLIVIVILGVLAGIVVFAVSAFNNDGKDVACKADKKNVEIALEAYYAKNGHRPASGVYTQLTDPTHQYLKEAPTKTNYQFSWDTVTGVVTVGAGTAAAAPAGC